ncbi:MAG: aspartate aminotransferase family protein [Anaerolineae bacterium]|nr:aspartate aminotransferase family protein [Anaerolineae bacterium]
MTTHTLLNTIAVEDAHTSGAYYKRPLTLVRGAGVYLWDDAGRRYLDATSGQGVALLGHAHPAVTAAVAHQAQTLITCPEIFYNDRRAELYSVLAGLLPGDLRRVFLCNSGAEAMEGALKIARLLTGRSGIVAARRGFHGRTLGALGMTWNKDYREPFAGWTPAVTHISYNDAAAAEAAITDDTAAVFVEPVQGEGGVYPADPDWLRHLRRLCDERGALLVLDEIQTGLGRTGRWFGFQHAGILPDLLTLGKGLAGGLPMGAVIWRASLGQIEPGTHGSTFGGNPLACAAAIAALTTLREADLPAHAARTGALLREALAALALPAVRDIRGQGLIIGLELRGRVTPALQSLTEQGVLALPAGKTVLRLLPPLILQPEHVPVLTEAVRVALSAAV